MSSRFSTRNVLSYVVANCTILTATILTTLTAFGGQKAIVVFKDQQSFAQVHRGFASRGARSFSQIPGLESLSQVRGEIADSLGNLQMVIIDVQSEADFAALSKSSLVQSIEKEVFHPAPRPFYGSTLPNKSESRSARSEDFITLLGGAPWGIAAVKAPQAWALSNKGKGARVLVLDTGIDKDHPALKENFENGQNFVGDDPQNVPYPYFDSEGHGTHVAGTIAGKMLENGFSGVAPLSKFLSGRVCSSLGCSNSSIVKAINWGISQKVDVISMSLGGAFSTAGEKAAIAQAEKAGLVVVAASGNSGTPQVSYPAAIPTVIAVGAVNSELKKTSFSQWGPELDIMAPGAAVDSSVPMGTGRVSKVRVQISGQFSLVNSTSFMGGKDVQIPVANSLVYSGLGKAEDFSNGNVAGKFALILRGEIAFADKVANALKAKAAGVVIFNNTTGLVQGSITSDGSVLEIPVAMIEQTVGQEIKARLDKGENVQLEIQTEKADYASLDGTSMATPHVSGVIALMKAANMKLTPAQVRQIVKETAAASTETNDQNQYGAGMIQADKAVEKSLSLAK